jgi:gas vesicle protein
MAQEESGYGANSVLFSFILGALVGAGIALLVAPKSGEETRKRIKELAEDAKERAESYMEEAKGKAAFTVEKGKELLDETKSIIATAVEAGVGAYEKEKQKAETTK